MTMNVNLHVTYGGPKLEVEHTIIESDMGDYAEVTVRVGDSELRFFMSRTDDIDKLAFAFETLAREARSSNLS